MVFCRSVQSLTTVTTHEVPLLNYYFVLADSRFLVLYQVLQVIIGLHEMSFRTGAFVCVFGAGLVLIHIEGISLHHMVLGDLLNKIHPQICDLKWFNIVVQLRIC
jgi:hypothetical protein